MYHLTTMRSLECLTEIGHVSRACLGSKKLSQKVGRCYGSLHDVAPNDNDIWGENM
jgi:hypothetical protein